MKLLPSIFLTLALLFGSSSVQAQSHNTHRTEPQRHTEWNKSWEGPPHRFKDRWHEDRASRPIILYYKDDYGTCYTFVMSKFRVWCNPTLDECICPDKH